jgi:membrane fusion protein (multidrug efflux system)
MTESLEQTHQAVLDPLPAPSNGNGESTSSALPEQPRARRYGRVLALALLGAAVVALAVVGPRYYRYAVAHESTDDAFIEGHVIPISPKVASHVARVLVDDNQHVNIGDLLVELDPRDFQAQVAQARANLAAAQAEAVRARADALRYEELLRDQAVSRQDVDTAVARNRAAAAQIAQLEAALREAELNLSYARILAPETGRVTRKSVEPGSYVQVGQALFSIVPDRLWVVANFKESQLRYMRPGQPAAIVLDAYPDHILRGHVDSIQRGSGARFSLLPPENATGNYVKVVQRVPVKIVFDQPPDPARPLGPGMSVEPTVKVK